MVGAQEVPGVAAFFLTDRGAAMAAGVEVHMHRAGLVAHHDHRLAPDARQPKVARIGNLRLVTDVDPGAVKDLFDLQLEHRRVREQAAVDAVLAHQGVDQARFEGRVIHDEAPGRDY